MICELDNSQIVLIQPLLIMMLVTKLTYLKNAVEIQSRDATKSTSTTLDQTSSLHQLRRWQTGATSSLRYGNSWKRKCSICLTVYSLPKTEKVYYSINISAKYSLFIIQDMKQLPFSSQNI